MKSFPLLKKTIQQFPDFKTFHKSLIDISLGCLDPLIYSHFKDKNLQVIVKKGEYKVENKHKVLAYADLLAFNVTLHLNEEQLPKDDYLIQIPDAILHELGHLRFQQLINLAMLDPKIKQELLDFCKICDAEGGVTLFADKYIKEEYGKKLREEKQHIINGIDIKYHENFAELFKLYHIFKIDSVYMKNLTLEDYVSKKAVKTREIYESLYVYC